MRRFFAVLLRGFLLFGFAPMAHADVAGLTPCSENARFQARAKQLPHHKHKPALSVTARRFAVLMAYPT